MYMQYKDNIEFTANVEVPTQAVGDSSLLAASTEFVTNSVSTSIPAGSITMFAGTSVPEGWLQCLGQSVSVVTYPDLYAAIGYSYGGSGDTFVLPNLEGRFPLGLGGSYSLGLTGGSATHQLTTAEMPSHGHTTVPHSHSYSDPGHSHTYQGNFFSAGDDNNYTLLGAGGTRNTNAAGVNITINSAEVAVNANGGDQPHNNMPPYLVLRFIIKT